MPGACSVRLEPLVSPVPLSGIPDLLSVCSWLLCEFAPGITAARTPQIREMIHERTAW